jgi:hypothetical protein
MIYYDGHPFHSLADIEDYKRRKIARSQNLRRESDRLNALYFYGSSGIRASQLSEADIVYLAHCEGLRKHKRDLFQGLLVGSLADINRARNRIHDTTVQSERARYQANPEIWLASYGNATLMRAYQEMAANA